MHIRKNDKVRVMAGNDRGKTGQVLKVFPETGRIIIEKVNLIKRHTRRNQRSPQGGIIEKEGPISMTNVMLVCPKCGAVTRTGQVILADGSRARSCKKCQEMIA